MTVHVSYVWNTLYICTYVIRRTYTRHTYEIYMRHTYDIRCTQVHTWFIWPYIRHTYEMRHTNVNTSYAGHTHVIRRTYTRHTQDIHTSYIWNIHVSYVWHTYDVPTCRGCIAVQCPLWHMYKCVPSYICTSVFPLTYVQVCSLLHMYKCVPSYTCMTYEVCMMCVYCILTNTLVLSYALIYCSTVAMLLCSVPSYICISVFPLTYVWRMYSHQHLGIIVRTYKMSKVWSTHFSFGPLACQFSQNSH